MFSVVTVPRELNPEPVIVIVSSTAASAGEITIDGLGVSKAVELPVIEPTVVDMICVPGVKDPPVVAAGTSITCVKPPEASVRIPPLGIASAPPIVNAEAVVAGGKPEPVIVTVLPVEALSGVTVTVPFGTVTLTVLLLLLDAVVSPTTLKLSVTVIYRVPAVTVVGTVTVPTPVPSEPIGNVDVPVNVTSLPPFDVPMVTVNSASTPDCPNGPSAVRPATVTVNAPPGLTEVGDKVTAFVVRLKEVSDTPTNDPLSVAVNTMVLLTPEPEVALS
jgi:hypothetical protein